MAARAWTPNRRRWVIAPPHPQAGDMARKLRTAPLVAQALCNRGIDDVEAARAFLNPSLNDLHDPLLMGGVDAAAERAARAVERGERIVIYGDYDVDGVAGVAILRSCLAMLGADVHYYVPHRLEEGYGVNAEAVGKIAADGTKLMITVDCGIGAHEPLAAARQAGMDVIITDHHTPGETLPDVEAVVHPNLPGEHYPNPNLCGAGVAFKLAWQIARRVCGQTRVDEPMRNFLLEATCLAALGTIADVVPLVGENRSLAVYGLRGLPATEHVGLRALLDSADLADERLDAYHVGFILAPRLNACGRMGHARLAVELLTNASASRAGKIAAYLAAQNTERQKVERAIAAEAIETVEREQLDAPGRRAIVLGSESWHAGVIGIVASRLVERFARPTILVAFDGDGGQGSGRSVPGFHMRDALAACAEHLETFGGHAMAGGIRVRREKFDAFADALGRYASESVPAEQLDMPLHVDAETTLASLDHTLASHLTRLQPHGEGNPAPLVAVRGCRVVGEPKRMGRTGSVVSVLLRQNGATLRAVGFNMGELAEAIAGVDRVDVAGRPALNTFRGRTNVELQLRDVKWE